MRKRLFDFICSLLGVLAFSPILVYLAFRIKREDGGPVFYRGERTGLHGKPFKIFKFRTMVVNADKIGGSSASDADPRITKTGRLLRKYKLDEFPQLINVLVGDMSFVGPRPEVKYYTDMYTKDEKAILTVRPGITDWASIWNSDEGAVLAGAVDPEKAYEELIRPIKLQMQLRYVRERSLFVDMKILFLTGLAIIRPESQAIADIRNIRNKA